MSGRCCPSCRGIAWPMRTAGDDCAAWVECCDDCAHGGAGFPDDEAAARALSQATGLPLRYAISSDGCGTWPYVMPAHLTLWTWGDRLPYPVPQRATWNGDESQWWPLMNAPLGDPTDPVANGPVDWDIYAGGAA